VSPKSIDVGNLLQPIAGENPSGDNLRYEPVYDEIKEARRADDQLERGAWQRDLKVADWDQVIDLSCDVLSNRSKDLQIAVWLSEALIKVNGFKGVVQGLEILDGLLSEFWDTLYPEIDDGDLEYRIGPLEFFNDKLATAIKEIPLTDSQATTPYSWLQWQESRQVGYEKDTQNQYGDVDESKRAKRQEMLDEGKLAPEEFDRAVAYSSKAFYRTLAETISTGLQSFEKLDNLIDEKFAKEAPGMGGFKEALEECERVVGRILKEKAASEPDEPAEQPAAATEEEARPEASAEVPPQEAQPPETVSVQVSSRAASPAPGVVAGPPVNLAPLAEQEATMWESALQILQSRGIKDALAHLFAASCQAPSVREKNRYRLLMAKLCLKAERPDLAKPLLDELYALIEELQLERWESPTWLGEVIEALYQCLTCGDERLEDPDRALTLLRKLCTTDVTKAMTYKT